MAKEWKILAVLLGAVLLVAGVRAPAPAQPQVFKLGILGPLTGPAARTGDEFKSSATLAFEAINHKIGPYQIELVWIDSQSDPEKATRAYEEAIVRKGVQAGCLNWHSSVAVAVMEVTAKHRVPHFFGMGATEVVNQKFHSDRKRFGYWMAKGWPFPAKLSIAYVNALKDAIAAGTFSPAARTVALWGEDTDWGRSFGRAIKGQFQDAGWQVRAEEYFAIDATEHYPLLTRFKDLGVAVVAGTSTAPAAMSAFIKQAEEVGLKALIVADGLGWVGEWYNLTGRSSDYVLDQIPQWPTAEARTWATNFERRFGFKPSPSAAGLAYDFSNFCIKILERALKKHGSLTSENIYNVGRDELWTGQLTYTGGIVMQKYRYTGETIPDPVIGQGHYIFPVLQYFGGDAKIIWPTEWRTSDLRAKSR